MSAKIPHEPLSNLSFETATAIGAAEQWLIRHQGPRGEWVGDVEWCSMLVSQSVIAHCVLNRPLSEAQRAGFLRTLESMQAADGSFGLHPTSPGYVFSTTLAYIALRLLGVDATDPRAVAARTWLEDHGGVLGNPTWGKVWLAMAGLYRWEGVNPIPVELWLLPEWSPLHPRRYYCHTRLIYLALGVLSALRFCGPARSSSASTSVLISQLRAELYGDTPFDRIDFPRFRNHIAPSDIFEPPSMPLSLSYKLLSLYERFPVSALRERAIRDNVRRIRFELTSTDFRCISPVNGLLNTLVLAALDPNDPDIDRALAGVSTWQRERPGGLLDVQGASSETWDTAFVVQAAVATDPDPEWSVPLARATQFLVANQLCDNISDGAAHYRDSQHGGWCFGDFYHRWPVSDTTAEAISALMAVRERFPDQSSGWTGENAEAAARFVLLRQNDDGGFGSYERKRGNRWLDHLNPSEMFGSCMTERSYVECTASCLKALSLVRPMVDPTLSSELDHALSQGDRFLRQTQHPDGHWPGFWGVYAIYGTMFGIKGLRATGATAQDPAVMRARTWLRAQQRTDGGWGEDWRSCLVQQSLPSPVSLVISTAWALLALMWAGETDTDVLERGVRWLVESQTAEGCWPREQPAGVFFGTAMLHYGLYKDTFPLWALNTWRNLQTKRP